ncbi:MAG: hypothetical protein JJU00_17590 [Opitutales bacterium]|nr:hypothetical protein [Opitutales bacterium]
MKMKPCFQRHSLNLIVTPGGLPWRMATVFNPGGAEKDGRIYMFERAVGSLRPLQWRLHLVPLG